MRFVVHKMLTEPNGPLRHQLPYLEPRATEGLDGTDVHNLRTVGSDPRSYAKTNRRNDPLNLASRSHGRKPAPQREPRIRFSSTRGAIPYGEQRRSGALPQFHAKEMLLDEIL